MHMRKTLVVCLLAFSFVSLLASAQSPSPSLPYTPSLDVTAMDKSADPCVDFYQYSCGGWQKNNPIPPDQTSWSVYGKLYQDNLNFLRGILEHAAISAGIRDAVTTEIGDFYAACMDEAEIEKRGLAAIKPQLDEIARLKSTRDMAPLVAALQLTYGRSIIFANGSTQDPDDSESLIAELDQGGLGLPDRDYYTKDDDKSKADRARYLLHVQKVFELLGDAPDVAKKNAATVMSMETGLAKASWTRVERRDPYKLKNKMTVADLEKLAPNFGWQAYYKQLQYPHFPIMNVTAPQFFKEVNAQLASASLEDWKTYLRFHVANPASEYLSSVFVQENFDFYRKYLRGAKEMQPRWKRCVQYTDRNLGEALGQAYVHQVFSPELKKSTLDMVQALRTPWRYAFASWTG